MNSSKSIYYFTLTAGDVTFGPIEITEPNNYWLVADCGGKYGEVMSREFAIHDWPETVLVRRQSIAVEIVAPAPFVDSTINTLNHVLNENVDGDYNVVTVSSGDVIEEEKFIDLSNYDMTYNPICIAGVTCFAP